ncbi:hypothetical protein K1T71_001330 [Dendrolimus kikuchii]|uniref:Uncharacterized protein n=1 Tax=Dendrolimus kikuchii TaxID=765133 RepID=A0ACC1DHX5_9NEOP|nr:hypothetical protein K1T71_001330 [Dendrolimus kikuchii]
MDEEKLICLVSSHECLFNVSSRAYSDKLVKMNAWGRISEEMGKPKPNQKHNYNHIPFHHRWRTFATNWHRKTIKLLCAYNEEREKRKRMLNYKMNGYKCKGRPKKKMNGLCEG